MDTIIYFYKKHGLAKPVIETCQMKDYLLVRVGMNVGENQWFAHSISPSLAVTAVRELTHDQSYGKADEVLPQRLTLGLFLQRLRKYREKRDRVRASRQHRRYFEEEHDLVCQELETFLYELNQFVDHRYDCRCVYGDAVRKGLMFPEKYDREYGKGSFDSSFKESGYRQDIVPLYWLPQLWQQYWQISEFDAYLQPQWVELLLKNVKLHHFVVLGFAECVPGAILHCARRMRSLRWILQERDCAEELENFVEEFYEDYGLAITLQLLEGEKAFARLMLVSKEPICVLDFTQEARISPGGVTRGSIWIDFGSVEEKARRILEYGEGISYFSLKEIWKRAGKP